MVAIHLACQSLRQTECDMALAGGVNLVLSTDFTRLFTNAGMLASDGHCKFGDATANGFVRSEGAGMVVLKRLSDAVAAGDGIYAVVRGSALVKRLTAAPPFCTMAPPWEEIDDE